MRSLLPRGRAFIPALKEVREALSPVVRLSRLGLMEAWRTSTIAYKCGNEKALEWRMDRGFAIYWGAMIEDWPRVTALDGEVRKAYLIRAAGRVQRVGYRWFILETVQDLDLAGYVKNERDGSVTVFIQGDEESLSKFLQSVKYPSPPAIVKTFTEKPTKPNPKIKNFTIKFGSIQEELQEGFGATQSVFTNYWEEFREFAKRTDENFKLILEKYGEISDRLTQIKNALTEESRKSREMLERIEADSKETRKMLTEALKLLREAVEKYLKAKAASHWVDCGER